ncbi:membrane-bound alkaline phosphatase-like [Lutzomyia longipalpis]|uniref:membrane-bound alkaline phosphatase-like n=1 Tax=Lutzomyia longipalpis TaxID=7200 RepID=UPI0024840C07|nr:membrane-bound alkaline phosphatase-like [Lutzomyia longipalpis]
MKGILRLSVYLFLVTTSTLGGVFEDCKDYTSEKCREEISKVLMHISPKNLLQQDVSAGRSIGYSWEWNSEYWLNLGRQYVLDSINRQLNTNRAKNVVFFLGDGMSIPTQFVARMAMGGEEQQLSWEKFPFAGLSKTYCVDSQVADSACSGTAYWSGIKANLGTLGVNARVPFGDCYAALDAATHTESIAKWAMDAGKSVGIVTTAKVTSASPAAAYAHVSNRFWENDSNIRATGCDPNMIDDIAKQLILGPIGCRLNVILGGGRGNMRDSKIPDEEGGFGERNDSRDLISEWLNDGRPNKRYVWNRHDLLNLPYDTESLLGLFESGDMQFYLESLDRRSLMTEPTLEEMTRVAINVLKKNQNGFFLFVEGGKIDHGHHYTLARTASAETVEMHKAVQAAREVLNEDDTLIVVTADHSHALSISGYPTRGHDIFGKDDRFEGKDGQPYMTLNYANGPILSPQYKEVGRINPDISNYKKWTSPFPFYVPLDIATHAGDDVGIFASGPFAHLFSGTMEQSHLPHLIAYVMSIGNGPRC